jgi:hypothetical protein
MSRVSVTRSRAEVPARPTGARQARASLEARGAFWAKSA